MIAIIRSIILILSFYSLTFFAYPQSSLTARGTEFLSQHKIDQAITYFNHALAYNPHNKEALLHRATASYLKRDHPQAAFYYYLFLSTNPRHAQAWFNLSQSLNELGYFDKSQEALEKLRAYFPTITIAKKRIVLHYLRNQQWDRAAQIYPIDNWWWYNRNVTDNRILIRHDGGFGDAIQFMRYAKRLHNAGAHVIVETPQALLKLFNLCPYIDHVIPHSNTLPVADEEYTVSTPRLALVMRNTLQQPSEDVPYMVANQKLTTYWQEQLSSDHDFKIGLCWKSSIMKDHVGNIVNSPRSIPLTNLAPLSTVPGISLYSLQKITGTDQLQNNDKFAIHDFGPDFDNTNGRFMDTAAVMKNLDLVITVDTSIAHLAGALCVPVWIIVPTPSDFRWFTNRDDSPWYPTMRIFRQTMFGTWDDVIQHVVNELKKIITP